MSIPFLRTVSAVSIAAAASAQASWTPFGLGCNGGPMLVCVVQNDQNIALPATSVPGESAFVVRNPLPTALYLPRFSVFTSSRTGSSVTVNGAIYNDSSGAGATVPTTPASTPQSRGIATIGSTPGWYEVTCFPSVCILGGAVFWVSLETTGIAAPTNLNGAPGLAGSQGRAAFGTGSWSPTPALPNPVFRLTCASGANNVPYLSVLGPPLLGNPFTLQVSDSLPSATVLLIWSFTVVIPPIDLGFLGAPGCLQHTGTDAIGVMVSNVNGFASTTATVPGSPLLIGVVFFNHAAELRAVNALGVVVTNAGRGVVN